MRVTVSRIEKAVGEHNRGNSAVDRECTHAPSAIGRESDETAAYVTDGFAGAETLRTLRLSLANAHDPAQLG